LTIHEVLSLTIHEVLYRQRPAEASRRRRISALPAYLPVNRRAKMTAAARLRGCDERGCGCGPYADCLVPDCRPSHAERAAAQ